MPDHTGSALTPDSLGTWALQEALNGVSTAVYIKNRDHRWLFANAACCEWLGRSPEVVIGCHESDLLPASLAQQFQDQDEQMFAGVAVHPDTASPEGNSAQIIMRRTQLTADGQTLICYLESLPQCPLHQSQDWATPWNTPQLNALLANVPAMIYQLWQQPNGNLHFHFISPGAYEVLGITVAAIQVDASQLWNQLHPLDRSPFEASLATSAATLEPWRWEGRYYKPDGQLRWLQTAARPHQQPDGAVVWDGLLMDITSRKQVEAAAIEQAVMEQALADNESRFRTITATIPGALIQLRVTDRQIFVDFVSDRIQDIVELSPATIMANAESFLGCIPTPDRQRLERIIWAAADTATAWKFEGRIITSAGSTRWWQIDATPVHPGQSGTHFCGVMVDCTARKAIEDAYQENDRRLRLALGVSGMGVWTWNCETDQMTWTTEPNTLFATTAVSFCDTFATYLQNVHPGDRALLTTATFQALENAQDYQLEHRLLLGDGTIRWVVTWGGPWHDVDGQLLGLMGTVLDITNRKIADAALKESEERHRTLINNIPGAVYRCQADPVWTLLFESEAISDITGYPIDHPIYQEDWRLLHPEDRGWVEAEITQAIAERRSFQLEYRICPADGEIRWVEETGQPISDATGTVQLIDGVLTDITRRKASEVNLQAFAQREALIHRISTQIRESLELTPILQTTVQAVQQQLKADRVVVYRFQPDWHGEVIVESVGSGWRSTLGEIGADNCFPEDMAEQYASGRVKAIPDIYTAGLDNCHLTYLEQLQVRANLIVPILLKKQLWGLLIAHVCEGPRLWTDSEIQLLTALAGQVGIAIGQADLYRQATDNAAQAHQQAQHLAETLAELQLTQAKLVQTEKMSSLGQLVAGVAHEINNPVSFIDGNISHAWEYTQDLLALVQRYQATYPQPSAEVADLMERIDLEFLAADYPKLLESMRVGAERIKCIVASLRTFSRMDEAEIKAVNLHDGLDSTVMILQHRLKAHGSYPSITLEKNYGPLPLVECYAGQLNQVFMNLLSNAIDALEEQIEVGNQLHSPVITLTTRVMDNGQVRITIADNGSGIAEEKRRRIFEPFYTTKPIGKGTGIGLSISYSNF
jgi:PAS domain S-box-containing protein